jgi:hypothetical protein
MSNKYLPWPLLWTKLLYIDSAANRPYVVPYPTIWNTFWHRILRTRPIGLQVYEWLPQLTSLHLKRVTYIKIAALELYFVYDLKSVYLRLSFALFEKIWYRISKIQKAQYMDILSTQLFNKLSEYKWNNFWIRALCALNRRRTSSDAERVPAPAVCLKVTEKS